MEYTNYDMNAYNLHLINTKKFKTTAVDISFRRKIKKEEVTIRNLLKEVMVNSSNNYPSERDLIKYTEGLYDLKLLSSSTRVGNYSIISFKIRFLDEKYTEPGMMEESIKFLLDIIFNPNFKNGFEISKKKIEKSILSLRDNKVKYAIFKLLEDIPDKPYSYNPYGYIEDLDKITINDLEGYYKSILKEDMVDIFVAGNFNNDLVKRIFKENISLDVFHKKDINVLVNELPKNSKIIEDRETDQVNQTQLTMLCSLNNVTDYERKYVSVVYCELLGGSSNSILFNTIREDNSYAYYVNSLIKPYDNNMIIYSGINKKNEKDAIKLIKKCLKDINHGRFNKELLENSKNTIISAIKSGLDSPIGLINNYYGKVLVDSLSPEERMKKIGLVTKEDIINFSLKVNPYSVYVLEGYDEED